MASRPGASAIVMIAYIGITFITTGNRDLSLLSGLPRSAGASAFSGSTPIPATIFMGDTGSLALGGAIGGLAVMTKTEESCWF